MDLWMIIQERSLLFSLLLVVLLGSAFLLFAIWKSRSNNSKRLTITMYVMCTAVILSTIGAIIFPVSFGYNA